MRSLRRELTVGFLVSAASLAAYACGGAEFTSTDAGTTGGTSATGGSGQSAGAGGDATAGTGGTTSGGTAGTSGKGGGTGGSSAGKGGKGGSSGKGGSAGTGGSAGAPGGSGGAAATCKDPTECPAATSFCQTAVCIGGLCGLAAANSGMKVPATDQMAGDCQAIVCTPNGGTTSIADDTDLPMQGKNACILPECSMGKPATKNAPAGTSCNGTGMCTDMGVCGSCTAGDKVCSSATAFEICGASGQFGASMPCPADMPVCTGDGTCVACNVATDCPAMPGECAVPTCVSNVCGSSPKKSGTPTSMQIAGDCQQNVCDGNGGVTSQPDVTDMPAGPAPACHALACSKSGDPYPPLDPGTSCGVRQVCDNSASCVCAPGTAPFVANGSLNTKCLSFAGAFEESAPANGNNACDGVTPSTCVVGNPSAKGCSCPSGFQQLDFRVLGPQNLAIAHNTCEIVSVCYAGSFDPKDSDFQGGYLVDPGNNNCLTPNPYTSMCGCPGGGGIDIKIDVALWSSNKGELHLCAAQGIMGQTFFGAFNAFEAPAMVPGGGTSISPNPEAGGCSCPSPSAAIAAEAGQNGCLSAGCTPQTFSKTTLGLCYAP